MLVGTNWLLWISLLVGCCVRRLFFTLLIVLFGVMYIDVVCFGV